MLRGSGQPVSTRVSGQHRSQTGTLLLSELVHKIMNWFLSTSPFAAAVCPVNVVPVSLM